MKRLVVLIALGLAAVATQASAQTEAEVAERIEALHGDSDGFTEALDLLQEAMRYGDPVTVAQLASYPLTVEANGEVYDILEEQDLVDNFDALVTFETQNKVAEQEYGDLLVNSDGVMLGDGEVWMALVCEDDACQTASWAIISIRN